MQNHHKKSKKNSLKKNCKIVIFSTLIISSYSFAAGNPDPVVMANKAGFYKCNSLVKDIFKYSQNAQEMRTNTRYSDETIKNSINIDMTFGKAGDTIVQSAHFERKGGVCYASSSISFNQQGSCVGIMSKDGNEYIDESAGTLWAKNKNGALRIMTQTGGICTSNFFTTGQMKEDRN